MHTSRLKSRTKGQSNTVNKSQRNKTTQHTRHTKRTLVTKPTRIARPTASASFNYTQNTHSSFSSTTTPVNNVINASHLSLSTTAPRPQRPLGAPRIHDPRYPSQHTEVIVEMARIRPQSWKTRFTMMGKLWWQNRQDKKRWKANPLPPHFTAAYAIEVFKIANECIKNPISNYSHNLHRVGLESAEKQYPVGHHMHLIRIAENRLLRTVFAFMDDNGVPFPWQDMTNFQDMLPPGFKAEFGVSPSTILFQLHVNKLLNQTKSKSHAPDSALHEFSLPQTYGVEGADIGPDGHHALPAAAALDGSTSTKSADDIIKVSGTKDEIEELRHLTKLFKVTTYQHSIELDHARYTSTQIDLVTARRMATRMLAVLNAPLPKTRLQQCLDEVDELGSFDTQEILAWQNDRFSAIHSAIEPFMIKLLGDEFHLKGSQGYVAALDGLEQFLWDPEVSRVFGRFRASLQNNLVPPADTPEVRQRMAQEQLRRQQNKDALMQAKKQQEQGQQQGQNEDGKVAAVSPAAPTPVPSTAPTPTNNHTAHAANQAPQQAPKKKADKWQAMEEELEKLKMQNQADTNESVQFDNLRAIYGENYDPATGTFIEPAAKVAVDDLGKAAGAADEVVNGEGQRGVAAGVQALQTQSKAAGSAPASTSEQVSVSATESPVVAKPAGPKPLLHPQRRATAAPAQIQAGRQ